MKSERRHELQHNALADWLVKTGEALKPYQNIILLTIIVLLGAYIVYNWTTNAAKATNELAWTTLIDGMESHNITELTHVIENYPDMQVSRAATVLVGDLRLINGCEELFNNKALGEQQLEKAIIRYETERREGSDPMLLARATFGLARAKESRGKLEEAEKYYREVVANWPDGAYYAAAQERLDDLKRPEIQKLYRYLDDPSYFDPQPEFSGETGTPGPKPDFDADAPKEGEIKPLDAEKK